MKLTLALNGKMPVKKSITGGLVGNKVNFNPSYLLQGIIEAMGDKKLLLTADKRLEGVTVGASCSYLNLNNLLRKYATLASSHI